MTLGSVALQGEMGSVAAVGHRLSNLADLNGAMGQLRAGIGQVRDSGNSDALTALATACTPIETLAQQIATARHNVGVVLLSYASEVTAIQDEVRRLRLQLEDARAQAAFTKRSLTEQQQSVSLAESVSADALMRTRMLESRAEEEAADLRRIERALDACDDARRAADAACVHKISGYSDAFASATMHAGTGVPKVTLASLFTVAASSTQAAARDAALKSLLSGKLTPKEVAETWAALLTDPNFDPQKAIEDYSFELANLNGLPFAVMSQAANNALNFALDEDKPGNLVEAYRRMGFQPGERSMEDFKKDLLKIESAFDTAKELVGENGVAQLLVFGRHDGVVTAGISMGDLDAATNVGVLTSGMNSNVQGISDPLLGFDQITKVRPGYAMVTWMGYRSPNEFEEPRQERADKGGVALANFLDGIAAQRVGDPPLNRLVAMGHSYGTNVVAEALKNTEAEVHAYEAIGSAGLKAGTTAGSLGVSEIYVTQASKDVLATIGRMTAFPDYSGPSEVRVNPKNLYGAKEFSSNEDGGGAAVTKHNIGTLKEASTPAGEDSSVGYFHPRSSTMVGTLKIMDGLVK